MRNFFDVGHKEQMCNFLVIQLKDTLMDNGDRLQERDLERHSKLTIGSGMGFMLRHIQISCAFFFISLFFFEQL